MIKRVEVSLSPVLSPSVNPLYKLGEHGRHTLINQVLHVLDRLLIRQLQLKLLLDFLHRFIRIKLNVVHARVDHQRKQVEYQVGVLPQDQKGRVAVRSELFQLLTFLATHCFNHLFGELHWWRVRLWVAAKNESKINVEQVAVWCHHQVVKVPVSNTK